MSSQPLVGAAVAIFVIAALLYYQAGASNEGFANHDYNNVPADLNQAPVSVPTNQIATSTYRPANIPGAPVAPREAMAGRRELHDLDSKITTWLAAASQRENEDPPLTPQQLQRRVMLQGRLADVRNQFATGLYTDTARQVAEEVASLRKENAGWGVPILGIAAIQDFGKDVNPEQFLTATQYAEFRSLFNAGLGELKGHTQPNPLQRVRLQQLQVIRQDLASAERFAAPAPPHIRMGAARLFLHQMLRPDQPLPTLFSMEPDYATQPSLTADPRDVISQLRDIQWKLTIEYNPAKQAIGQAVAGLLSKLQQKTPPPSKQEVESARSAVIEFHEVLHYDPDDLLVRAQTLCQDIREAFPADAEALGCPKATITDRYVAESTINTVCDRIRFSVPNVSPEQFNCPPRAGGI